MGTEYCFGRYDDFVSAGCSGTSKEVDLLMNALVEKYDIATTKLVDFALSLVQNREGIDRIEYYLFHGSQVQRNYAALYFKRKGFSDLISAALDAGKIDIDQAFSR